MCNGRIRESGWIRRIPSCKEQNYYPTSWQRKEAAVAICRGVLSAPHSGARTYGNLSTAMSEISETVTVLLESKPNQCEVPKISAINMSKPQQASIQISGRQLCSPRYLVKKKKKKKKTEYLQTYKISSLWMHRASACAFRIPPLPYTCLILLLVHSLFTYLAPPKIVGFENLPYEIYTNTPISPSQPQPQIPRSRSHTPGLPPHLAQRNLSHSHDRQTFPVSAFFAETMRMAYQMILLSSGVR